MFRIKATGPTRMDLAGGTLDIWPIHHLINEKATINIAIDLNSTVEIKPATNSSYSVQSKDQNIHIQGSFDKIINNSAFPLLSIIIKYLWRKELPPLEITTHAKSPQGAGIGGSSTLAIITYAALRKARQVYESLPDIDEQDLVNTTRDLEAHLIRIPTGCQDYWPCIRGGINLIDYKFGKTTVHTLQTDFYRQLKEWVILYYSGKSRESANNNWNIYQKFFNQDQKVLDSFTELGKLSSACAQEIKNSNLEAAFKLSKEEWLVRKKLWPQIETIETKKIDLAARKSGAYFTRICGAGGGGVMSIFAPPKNHQRIKSALQNEPGHLLAAQPTGNKLTITKEEF